jgi:hypothetical protein
VECTYPDAGDIQGGPQLLFRESYDGLVGGDEELSDAGKEKMLTDSIERL